MRECIPFCSQSLSEKAIAMRSDMTTTKFWQPDLAAMEFDCWGGKGNSSQVASLDQTGSHNSYSSSLASAASFNTQFKLGPRLEQELALSSVAQIPKGENGEMYSHGSRHHPHNCTPCLFLKRNKGCFDGALCGWCHYSHPEKPPPTKRRGANKKACRPTPLQHKFEPLESKFEPVIIQTVKNGFVEWVLEQEDENTPVSPSLCRAHSAPSLR